MQQQLFGNKSEEPDEDLNLQVKGSGGFSPLLGINEAVSGVLCPGLASPEQTGKELQKGSTKWLGGWVCYASREAKGKPN